MQNARRERAERVSRCKGDCCRSGTCALGSDRHMGAVFGSILVIGIKPDRQRRLEIYGASGGINSMQNSAQLRIPESGLVSTQVRDRHTSQWALLSAAILSPVREIVCLGYRWRDAFRSFRAHIRIQYRKMGVWVDCAPPAQFQYVGRRWDEAMCARVEGIKKLVAKYSWVDAVDMRMYLIGFDAGEKYSMVSHASRSPDAQPTPQQQ